MVFRARCWSYSSPTVGLRLSHWEPKMQVVSSQDRPQRTYRGLLDGFREFTDFLNEANSTSTNTSDLISFEK